MEAIVDMYFKCFETTKEGQPAEMFQIKSWWLMMNLGASYFWYF